jgi:hypothetical protein
MPISQQLTYYCPSLLLAALIVGIGVTASIIGILVVRRMVPHQKLKSHNDIAGAIFNTLGVAYAVLLAFVVIVVWQGYDKAQDNVYAEANCVIDLARDAVGLPQDFRHEVVQLAGEYLELVVNDEWKTLARGERSMNLQRTAKGLVEAYASYEPKTETEKAFYSASVNKLNELLALRNLRISSSKSGLHGVLWMVLVIGGMATIAFPLFFGSENPRSQMIMTSLLATVISLILFLILAYDYPFTGDSRIRPVAFEDALKLGRAAFWQSR